MRKIEIEQPQLIDKVARLQGRIFYIVVKEGYDLKAFVEYWMHHDVRWMLDKKRIEFCYLLPMETIKRFHLDLDSLPKKEGQDMVFAEWLGKFYEYVQSELSTPSMDLYEELGFDEMATRYQGLHDFSTKHAAKVCIEGKQLRELMEE